MKIIISERQQKLIKEDNLKDSLVDVIKDEGINSAVELVGGIENLSKTIKDKLTKSDVYVILTKSGYPTALKVAGGVGNFLKKLEVNGPDEFLKLFDNLKSDVFEPNPQWSFLKDHNGTKIIGILTYPSGRKQVSINNKILGGVLSYVFDIAHHRVEGVLSEWIKDVYNIDDFYVSSSGGFSEG
jgi:hypothetical protein